MPMLPLVAQNDIEQQRSWEGISTPHDLAMYMARVLAVNPNSLLALGEIVFSDTQPTGEDKKKLWIKTDLPVAIGVPSGGVYKMFYEYSPNIPILWTVGEIPSYMRKLTSAELVSYSLTDPSDSAFNWIIFPI